VAKKEAVNEFSGLKMETTTREERAALNLKNGVKVVSVDGIFKKAGIPAGFIITHIANEPVYSGSGAADLLQSLQGSIAIEGKTADGQERIFALKMPAKTP
jgi:S1-C subfamily serine protease